MTNEIYKKVFEIDEKILAYIPKRDRKHIIDLYKQNGKYHFLMEFEDGLTRSRTADDIAELKWMVKTIENDHNAEF